MKDKIVRFFDEHAPLWDSYQKEEEKPVIREILKRAGVGAGDLVLDVACGTGVLAPFFRELGIPEESVRAIDISPRMIEILRAKHPRIRAVVGDFEDSASGGFPSDSFTRVIVFNSFPHFAAPARLFEHSHRILRSGGRMVVAHSLNRAKLDEIHRRSEAVKEHMLLPDPEIRNLYMAAGFRDVVVEDASYFYAEGTKS